VNHEVVALHRIEALEADFLRLLSLRTIDGLSYVGSFGFDLRKPIGFGAPLGVSRIMVLILIVGNERLTDLFAAACHTPDGFTSAQSSHEMLACGDAISRGNGCGALRDTARSPRPGNSHLQAVICMGALAAGIHVSAPLSA
jgi:hypothetical protein